MRLMKNLNDQQREALSKSAMGRLMLAQKEKPSRNGLRVAPTTKQTKEEHEPGRRCDGNVDGK